MGRDHADILAGDKTALAAYDNLRRRMSFYHSIQDDHGLGLNRGGVLAPEAVGAADFAQRNQFSVVGQIGESFGFSNC